MKKITRGEFLGWSGASLLGGLGIGGCTTGSDSKSALLAPDLVALNGKVYTVDDDLPTAEAFAVKNGRFVAVGSSDDVRNLVSASTEVIDCEGMTVTPGFIDAHCHPGGVRELLDVDLDLRTIDDIKKALAAKAADTAPGYWVDGFKYDDTKVKEARRINKHDLDEAVPNHPVRVSHRGGHIAWYNSKALEMAGVTNDIEDPPGGRFEKDENGELTGLVEERAQRAFADVGQRAERSRADRRAGVAHISKLMTAAGLTSVHQTGSGTDSLIALQDAYRAGEMRFRMYLFPSGNSEFFPDAEDGRHSHRVRRRVASHWSGEVWCGRLGVRTHHVHEHALRGSTQ